MRVATAVQGPRRAGRAGRAGMSKGAVSEEEEDRTDEYTGLRLGRRATEGVNAGIVAV